MDRESKRGDKGGRYMTFTDSRKLRLGRVVLVLLARDKIFELILQRFKRGPFHWILVPTRPCDRPEIGQVGFLDSARIDQYVNLEGF